MDTFVAKVEQFVRQHGLIKSGDGIVVGFSGGPDSTALLVAFAQLRAQWQLKLVAAHLDHGLRGAASDGDAQFAARLAKSMGVEFVIERVNVAELARESATSLEAAGRQARYKFFRRVLEDKGFDSIAVGHHRDDQVENVLWRLLSGSGSDGLAGMRPRQGEIIRPLLAIPQREIVAFLKRNDIAFRIDATNEENQFLRNRIRNKLLPQLREQYNRRVDDALWRMSRLLADEVDYLDQQADMLRAKARTDLPGGGWYDSALLMEAHVAIRRRALRRIVWSLSEDDESLRLTESHVADIETIVAGQQQVLQLPKGVRVVGQQGKVRFYRVTGPSTPDSALPSSLSLPVPGHVRGWSPWEEIHAQVLPEREVQREDLSRPGHAYLDYETMGAPLELQVRRWIRGDRLKPLGAPGSRKLQDIFVDRRIPRQLRHKLPVIALGDEIVWVIGVAVADRFKIGPNTKEVLHIWTDGGDEFALLR